VQLIDYPTPEQAAPHLATPAFMRAYKASADPCATCAGSCCSLVINITVLDVARLAVNLTVDPREFCKLNDRPSQGALPAVEIDGKPQRIALRAGMGKPCVLLHTIDSSRRCGVYALRPMTCRLYPFKFVVDDHLEGPELILCPQKWLVSKASRRRLVRLYREAAVEEQQARRALFAFRRQRRFPHTEEGLMRYALVKGSALLGLDPAPLIALMEPRRLGKRLW
jgi:Fe-S-cluster containining protein